MKLLFALSCALVLTGQVYGASVLVLPFHNASQFSDLTWVGESVADRLTTEFGAAGEIVYDRATRVEALRRLSLRYDGDFTKATLIHVGESLDADYICFGTFDVNLPSPGAQVKDGVLRISAQFIDLRKMHEGPDFSETGNLTELWRLQEHLAFESLQYLDPNGGLTVDQFLSPQKSVRVDAEESYVRGLMTNNRDQRQKWLLQAAALDPKFPGPAFELGNTYLEQKQYGQALNWLRKVPASDPRYVPARFKMGLAAYGAGEYAAAADDFREVLRNYPISEVYNNLGAAETAADQPSAADDLKHALESDPGNAAYLLNLGLALLKRGDYDAAAAQFQKVLQQRPDDADAKNFLARAQARQALPAGTKLTALRLKSSFNDTAFRQLKAMIQPQAR